MTKHKAIALTGLVLALAILGPASAMAKNGGTKPVKGTASGTISTDPRTGAFSGETRGVLSHLGKVTAHLEGTGAPTPEGTFAGSGTATIVAANGDRLTGTFTLSTTELLPTGHTATVVITITGGTGRFAHASGKLTVICLVGPPSQVKEKLLSTLKCKVTGHLNYGHRRHRDGSRTRAER